MPKNPATQKQKLNMSCTGVSIQWDRERSIQTDVHHAAAARNATATNNTGHHCGASMQVINASASGYVKICPAYPNGRDRLVLRAQRKR